MTDVSRAGLPEEIASVTPTLRRAATDTSPGGP
jgi:hypothetical protein